MRFYYLAALISVTLVVSSCASITSIPLKEDGLAKVDKAEEGFRYYKPKPYLLVTELPVAPQSPAPSNSPTAAAAPAGGGRGGGDGNGNNAGGNNTTPSQPQSSTPTAPATDTSFSASMASYSLKLVYLPDYKHPYTFKMTSGLFGTTTAAPTLQDGWMLTSLSGSVDSGGSSLLSALSGLVSAGSTGGTAAAAGKTKGGVAAAPPPVGDRTLLPKSFGPDGTGKLLNAYDSVTLVSYGQSVGKGELAPPAASDLLGISKEQASTFVTAISVGAKSAIAAAKNAQSNAITVTWGKNVLPPGLYALADDDKITLTAVTYFCDNGPQVAPCPHDH